MPGPATLLVIGIHREELAFGERVAQGLDPRKVAVLRIGEGLSGRRPRPDERFHYDTLHRALYRQLLPLVDESTRLVLDLHTGQDLQGPCADLICARPGLLAERLADTPFRRSSAPGTVRILRLGPDRSTDTAGGEGEARVGRTAVPAEVWRNLRFLYVGVEVFLPEAGAGTPEQQDFARRLVTTLAETLTTGEG